MAKVIRAEGWKWLEVAVEFPYGHSWNLRDIAGEPVPPTALTVSSEIVRCLHSQTAY